MSINLTLSALSRAQLLERLRQGLRPGQRRIADWPGGTLAVSAVPGSGKSTGMAIAAAILLAQRYTVLNQHAGGWEEGQSHGPSFVIQPEANSIEQVLAGNNRHLLLVTFTRSAVANLKTKIRQYLRELGVPPQGFMVHTLHGLALHIATRHPEMSGLDLDRLTLISPTQSNRLIRTSVEQWWSAHPQTARQLLEGRYFDGEETERLRRQMVLRSDVLPNLAATVIHEAKSSGLSPQAVWELAKTGEFRTGTEELDYPVLAIAAGLYERYQRLLQQRGFIDYDDMILAALHVLRDFSVRQFWQSHILAVFEDEAQDSSPLQTQLLEILATDPVNAHQLNLVRVGDPNQAINSTFTPADPIFFADFCAACQRSGHLAEMDQAGRSSPVIMAAANFLLDWVNQRYGESEARARSVSMETLPFRPQHIHPVSAFDPQPDANPDPEGAGLEIRFPPDIYQSVNLIARRVAELLTREPEARAAILVRENRQGQFISRLLRQPDQHSIDVNLTELGIAILEVNEHERHSHVPTEMLTVLQFLDRPHSPDALRAMLQLLIDRQLVPAQDLETLVNLPEQFLYPSPLDPALPEAAVIARRFCTGLLRARFELPHFQLMPFIALTLQYEQTELATADKLAHRITSQTFSHSSMAATLETLHEIVRAERFEPVDIDEADARYIRPGQLTIITMHKAKGLDWDFVFLPFLHDHVMPGTLRVLPQAQFLGDISLPEVARVQLRTHIHGYALIPDLQTAWSKAAALKTAEEYRLLYVAMTRARRLLWMSAAHQAPFSWSKPEQLDGRSPCPVMPALVKQFPQSLPSRRQPG
jgi:DNA helicase II / ATP-dependent DNA helicase PcrA